MMSRLIFLFVMMQSVFYNIYSMWTNPSLQAIATEILEDFDISAAGDLLLNVVNNSWFQAMSLLDMPGRSCSQEGVRMGIAMRKMLNLYIYDES